MGGTHCPGCGEAEETAFHFLGQCETFGRLRFVIFGSVTLRRKEIVSLNWSQIVSFGRRTKRFDERVGEVAVVTGFKDCIYEFLDGERIENEFSKSNDVCNNTVNSVQSPQVNLCLKEKIDIFKLSLSKDERKRWSTINNILLKIVELISENESNEVIGFVENSGINCLNSRLEEVEKCFGDSNNNYYSLGLNHFHIDSCKNYDKIQSCVTRELQENCSDASIDSFFKFARSSLCSDNKIIRSRRSLRRVVRNIGMGDKVLHVKNQLIKNCKSQEKLNQSLENMEACLGTETMFITPRDEYIDHINTCSKNVTKLLDECLPEKIEILSKIYCGTNRFCCRLLYDDFKEIALGLGPCIDKLKKHEK
ncbi:hypothetical protein NQ317_015260 [Molorchus minor]|uniref:Uncharacterized protein n=1 Tax=Molorchus minor TaxID=1323400 RepID=A0ABQ9IYI9_9CUCU|nr:hypothetical protein NQ317_015260 [Molorchus minor]